MPAATVLVVQNATSDPPGRLADWLTLAGLTLDVRNAQAGDPLPVTLDGFEGLIVLGGEMRAADDDLAPWLPTVRALLHSAVEGEVPTLGVCLGGQLLALATGGSVGPNPRGPEYGSQLVAKRAAAAADPLFGALPITPDVIQWHVDAVTKLPPGAIHLASSPLCENQAYRIGRLAWGIQFHIETTPALLRMWAELDADPLAEYDVTAILRRADALDGDLVSTWAPFAQAFAAVVEAPHTVAPARGGSTSTPAPITDPAAIRAALAAEMAMSRAPHVLPMPGMRRPDIE
ncbi:MAG: type 1 glutamine amidotransferase [Actinomycetota bacterium]|nr:type 1 glutamine amidotransferase [Actinomycetota bacterium]